MTSKVGWIQERKQAAEMLLELNNRMTASFGDLLRDQDTALLLAKELGKPLDPVIPMDYFQAIWRVLAFGPIELRAKLLLGGQKEIEDIATTVIGQDGLYTESGMWMDL